MTALLALFQQALDDDADLDVALQRLPSIAAQDPKLPKPVKQLCHAGHSWHSFRAALKSTLRDDELMRFIDVGKHYNILSTLLPLVITFHTNDVRIMTTVKRRCMSLIVTLAVPLSIIWGLSHFVTSRFSRIYNEMLAGEPLPVITQFVLLLSRWNLAAVPVLILLLVAFVMLWRSSPADIRIRLSMCKWSIAQRLLTARAASRVAMVNDVLQNTDVNAERAEAIINACCESPTIRRHADAIGEWGNECRHSPTATPPANLPKWLFIRAACRIYTGDDKRSLFRYLDRCLADEIEWRMKLCYEWLQLLVLISLVCVVAAIVVGLFIPLLELIT